MTKEEFNEKRTKIQKEREASLKMLDDLSRAYRGVEDYKSNGVIHAENQVRGLIRRLVEKEIDLIRSCSDKDIFDIYFKPMDKDD